MSSLLAALLLDDVVEKEWNEDLHPRGEGGRFAGAGFTQAGADPKALARAAGQAARMGMGGSKTLAREAKQRARAAGAPKGESVRAGAGARAAVRRELGDKYVKRPEGFKPVVPQPKPVENFNPIPKPGPGPAPPPPGPGAGNLEQIQHNLEHGEITGGKMRDPYAGNVNETHFLNFANGEKGVWKPKEPGQGRKGERGEDMQVLRRNITPGSGGPREVGAYKVASLVGMTDLVPVTTFREYNGRTGSIQHFVTNAEQASNSGNPFDGKRDAARATAFDFVIGNEDRHQNNWMIQGGDKIKLIDHGLSFPQSTEIQSMRGFISTAGSLGLPGSPSDHAAAYVANKDSIASSLRDLKLPESAIKGVGERIDMLSKMRSWSDIEKGAAKPRERGAGATRPAFGRGGGGGGRGGRNPRQDEFAQHILNILRGQVK
jgi:hypothetical protein